MALEKKKKEEEGKVEEGVVNNAAENAPIAPEYLKMIQDLQSQVESLKANPPAQNTDNQLLKMLIDKLDKNEGPRTGQFVFDTMHNESDIDPDDVLDQKDWVTFVTHKALYVIVDDRRNNKNIKAPFDKIVFKYQYTRRVKNGKETDLINLSMYVCKSKKELEWLRSHTLFGIMFFDNISSALTDDVEKASRLARQLIALQNVGQHQVLTMAKSRGIPISGDIQQMKSMIAHSVVDEQMAREKGFTEKMLQEQKAEQELLEG